MANNRAIKAKMIERALGQTSELGKFDILRTTMKNKMHKKQKPTALEKVQYKKLSSVLNIWVFAIKRDLKQQRLSRKHFIKHKELSPTNSEYKKLRKQLDHAKKLCQCWEDCIAL